MIGVARSTHSVLLTVLFVATAAGCAVSAQQGPEAMQRLHFMAGAWTCRISSNAPIGGAVDHVSYRFTPDGYWMEETSDTLQGSKHYTSIQVWGYDTAQKRLVAHQFTAAGVATKSVDGWQGDTFVSHRDDNGATVSIVPKDARAFDWLIVSADHSSTVREECTR